MSKRVVVVGAGVIGLFCALRLAQRGAQVVVLEGEREDHNVYSPTASLAAAGMLAPLSDVTAFPEQHPDLDRLALESFDLWRAQSKGALWEDGLRFEGGLFIAPDEKGAEKFRAHAASLGRRVHHLSDSQWRKRSGFETRVENAFYVEDEGIADPVRVISGLVMDARRHGIIVTYGADVETVSPNSVKTYEQGSFEADIVLLAPGAWASDQMAALAPALNRIRSVAGHIVPVSLAQKLHANVHGQGFYLARRRADDVVLGATMEFDRYERKVLPDRVAELLGAAERSLPGQVRLRQDARPWVGVRPVSPDWAPMIGPSGPVLVACGHSRNGWLLAPITAEIICAHVFGAALSPLWAKFTPDRFEA